MNENAPLTLFAHLLSRPDVELDLAQAALLIAECEYPGLDMRHYVSVLDDLGRAARRRLDAAGPISAEDRARVFCAWLYGPAGFRGNTEDYYDPKNSFLNDVLERRRGIPISLALVLLEVSRRAGLETYGVAFPGHFLVRTPGKTEPLIIDPFDGRTLSRADLAAVHKRLTGDAGEVDPRLLDPCNKRQMLFRMLNNLRNVYLTRGDRARHRSVLERMVILAPTPELCSELEQLGGSRVTIRVNPHGLN